MRTVRLGDIVTITKGKKPVITRVKQENSARVLQIEDLRSDKLLKFTDQPSGVYATEDDVLIAWDGANAGTVGFNKSGFVGSTLAVLKKIPGADFQTDYLARFLQSKFRYLRGRSEGAVIPHLNRSLLENLRVPYLPKSDQISISTILQITEDLLAYRNESLECLEKLVRSLYHDMFVQGSPLGVRVKLEDLAIDKNSFRTGPFGSDLLHSEFSAKGDVRVLGIDNIVNNQFEDGVNRYISYEKYKLLRRYTVFPGDVLISIMGTIGRTAVVPPNTSLSINTKHLAALTLDPNKILPEFLSNALRFDPSILKQIRDKARGAIMNGLNLDIIKSIQIDLPDLVRQKEFVDRVQKIEALKSRFKHSQSELTSLHGSVEHKAFKGTLHVDIPRLVTQYGGVHDLSGLEIKDGIEGTSSSSDADRVDARLERDLEEAMYYSSLNWELFLKKHFLGRAIDNDEIQRIFYNRGHVTGEDFNYESLKEFIFKELGNPSSFLRQVFNEETKQLEIRVYEAPAS